MTRSLPVMPTTRAGCADIERPCPFTHCRHHMDAGERLGAVRRIPLGSDLDTIVETCSLDVADRGPHTHADVALMMGLSRARIGQVSEIAERILAKRLPAVLGMDAEELANGWSRAEGNAGNPDDWFDAEFKAAVHRAYERIVPEAERGANALRSIHSTGDKAAPT